MSNAIRGDGFDDGCLDGDSDADVIDGGGGDERSSKTILVPMPAFDQAERMFQ